MRLFPDSKVYVLCPANTNSGGPELLHQLCSQLIQYGVDARMFYSPSAMFKPADPVHDFYKKYHLPYVLNADDSERNIFVVPEVSSGYLYAMKKFQRVLWWLSVDNYVKNVANSIGNRVFNALTEPLPKLFYFGGDDLTHFVQSEYARQFVKLNGVPEHRIYMVEDYLNQAFLSRAAQVDLGGKENFVAFNPRKGFEVTQQLMKLAPDISWRPIQNMTPAQVQELLAKAKVYIDFGNHPGKDRIPREAAISGCVVITGRRGSAGNDVDINIPAEFKFDERNADTRNVIAKIRAIFADFGAAHALQADYRARILDDKNRFAREVAEAFGIRDTTHGGGGVRLFKASTKKVLSLLKHFCNERTSNLALSWTTSGLRRGQITSSFCAIRIGITCVSASTGLKSLPARTQSFCIGRVG